MGEQKGGSVVTENPKANPKRTQANPKTSEGFRVGITQTCLENEDGGGGDRESHQKLLGGITSVTQHSKGVSAKLHERAKLMKIATREEGVLRAVLSFFRTSPFSRVVIASHADVLRDSSRVPAPRTFVGQERVTNP